MSDTTQIVAIKPADDVLVGEMREMTKSFVTAGLGDIQRDFTQALSHIVPDERVGEKSLGKADPGFVGFDDFEIRKKNRQPIV